MIKINLLPKEARKRVGIGEQIAIILLVYQPLVQAFSYPQELALPVYLWACLLVLLLGAWEEEAP